MRVAVAERLLTEPHLIVFDPEGPDDFSVACASVEQAMDCLDVAREEIDTARFAP